MQFYKLVKNLKPLPEFFVRVIRLFQDRNSSVTMDIWFMRSTEETMTLVGAI